MESPIFYRLILWILAAWRVTHLLNAEDEPWNILARFRHWISSRLDGKLVDCFYCLSLWIAAPCAFLLGSTWPERVLLWPALSGGAILVEHITVRQREMPLQYWEVQEDANELLRERQNAFGQAGRTTS